MFVTLSAVALVAFPLVSALTVNPLTDATAGGTVTITWTASTTDPKYFSFLMVNPTNFHNTFAIANTVQTDLGKLDVTLPQMPAGDGYSLQAIAVNNVNTIYSQSSEFSVGDTASATSTDSTTSTTSSTSSGTVTTASVTTTTQTSSASTSAAKKSTSSSSATPSSLSGSATPLRLGSVAPAAALLLSAVAGAAMIF